LALGLGLYVADLDIDLDVGIPGLDVAGIAAGICIVVGAVLLFDDVRIVVGVLVAVSLFTTVRAIVRYRITRFARYPSRTETVVGQTGYTTTALEPRGSVKVDGELWSAVPDSGEPIEEGAEVIVADVDGLTLRVFKASETDQ
jgi:membrane-bound ClpP family serine protease